MKLSAKCECSPNGTHNYMTFVDQIVHWRIVCRHCKEHLPVHQMIAMLNEHAQLNERLKKELRDERAARLAEWLEEDRIDKEQFDDAIEELQALRGE